MTKARDLANLISGGFTEADIPNLSASKITSGTFADARISNSSVSQYASTFDDNKIVNDISTLGLRVHTQENLNASNTNSASFDVFQDSSGITNLSGSKRNQNEYITSETDVLGSESLLLDADNQSISNVASGTFDTNLIQAQNWSMVDDATHTNHQGHYNTAGNRYQNTLWGICLKVNCLK